MINCKLTVTIANIYWAYSVPNTINSTLQIISYLTQQIRRPRRGEIQSLAQAHGTCRSLPCVWPTPEPKLSTARMGLLGCVQWTQGSCEFPEHWWMSPWGRWMFSQKTSLKNDGNPWNSSLISLDFFFKKRYFQLGVLKAERNRRCFRICLNS